MLIAEATVLLSFVRTYFAVVMLGEIDMHGKVQPRSQGFFPLFSLTEEALGTRLGGVLSTYTKMEIRAMTIDEWVEENEESTTETYWTLLMTKKTFSLV